MLVDRDRVLGVREARRGTPHTRHAHGLHARGHQILEELFPGLTDELRRAGVPTGDLGEMRWYFNARQATSGPDRADIVTAPRPVLENHVRTRVAALPNVTFREQRDVLRPAATPAGDRVRGVWVRPAADAPAGNSSRPSWWSTPPAAAHEPRPGWRSWDIERPVAEQVKIGLAYTTRLYRARPEMFEGVQSINPVASPAHPRGAFFGQIGPEQCILSLTGILGDRPPTEPDAFLDFTRSLPVPDVYEAVRDAEPLDDPVSFTFPASVRRRYERLTRLPDGLLMIGDAVCSFNPVYGQGMSVAAIEAMTLREHLRAYATPQPCRFMADIARVIDVPWDISAGGDLDFPGVQGKRTAKVRLGNAYMARLQYAATKDARVTDSFMRVAGLMDPPEALMHRPYCRVLRHAVRRPAPGVHWLDGERASAAPAAELPEAA